MSEPNAITGLPDPQVATHAVGMPDCPRVTLKPNFSSCAVRYRDVSTSCMPSSPKLKTESTISCASLAISSTARTASFFCASSLALSCASEAPATASAITAINTRFIHAPRIGRLKAAATSLLLRRGGRPHRRVLNAQLIEIRRELGRVVIELAHLLAVLVEDVLVEMNRGRRVRLDQRDV